MTFHAVASSILTLSQSERGRQAIRDLHALLDNGARSLDGQNQRAVMTILAGAFGEWSGSTADALRSAAGRLDSKSDDDGFDRREAATLLAALRHWQREIQHPQRGSVQELLHDVATDGGEFEELSADEIDALCERINVGGAS